MNGGPRLCDYSPTQTVRIYRLKRACLLVCEPTSDVCSPWPANKANRAPNLTRPRQPPHAQASRHIRLRPSRYRLGHPPLAGESFRSSLLFSFYSISNESIVRYSWHRTTTLRTPKHKHEYKLKLLQFQKPSTNLALPPRPPLLPAASANPPTLLPSPSSLCPRLSPGTPWPPGPSSSPGSPTRALQCFLPSLA